jgi:branched-chain amino acid transport system ATP-binding protein
MDGLLLDVRGVSKRFSGLQVLHDVDLRAHRGSIVGVMGANGAGKTTLFSLIAGQHKPDSGEILLAGHSIAGRRPDEICRRGVARTFQVVRPFGGLTVLENVMTAALFGAGRCASERDAVAVAHDVLRDVGLAQLAHAKASELTLSNQKRLEVARAVATGPSLVMLDEVMAGLTATEVSRMLETIRTLHETRGLTILVVEHVMQALMRLADRIVVLHLGKLVMEGTPAEVKANEQVDRIYFGGAH